MVSLPTLFLPKSNHFGLSIGRTSLRGVELDESKRVRSFAEVQLAPDVFNEGVILKPEIFIESLKKLLIQGKFSSSYVNVCFSETHAYSREYKVPLVSLSELHEAISWHVKDLFPFAEDEIYFDWKILEKGEKEYNVSVVAVQKKVLDPLVDVLSIVGLKPLSFEPGASAIARLLGLKADEFAIITEINRRSAYVTLVQAEKALFTTVVNYTTEDTPETYLHGLIQTINDVKVYYKNKGILKDQKERIVLTGEVASAEWVSRIKSLTNSEVSILTTPIGNPAFNKAFAASYFKIAPPYDPDSINLIPTSLQQFYDAERNFHYYKSLLVRTTGIAGFLLFVSIGAYIAISYQRQHLDARDKLLTNQSKLQNTNTQNVLLLNAQAKNIVTLSPLRSTPKDKIQVIQSIVPEGILISQLEYDDSKLLYTIAGIAQKREDLLLFRAKLEQTEEFTKVTLPLGSLELPLQVQFTMTFLEK